MSEPRWYLIHSKARQEDVAELNLRRLGVETFCPRFRKLTASIAQSKEEVVFPGYIFIKVDMTTGYRKVTYAHGVLRVVRFGVTPAFVEEEIIESIRKRIHKGFASSSHSVFPEIGSDRPH